GPMLLGMVDLRLRVEVVEQVVQCRDDGLLILTGLQLPLPKLAPVTADDEQHAVAAGATPRWLVDASHLIHDRLLGTLLRHQPRAYIRRMRNAMARGIGRLAEPLGRGGRPPVVLMNP